jgi:NADH dehydrogenase (ubiquinone) 1 alpha/beta subcomplex 1
MFRFLFSCSHLIKLSLDAHFTNDLGLDSLDTVEVLMNVEEEFSVDLPDETLETISTPRAAAEFIFKIPTAR